MSKLSYDDDDDDDDEVSVCCNDTTVCVRAYTVVQSDHIHLRDSLARVCAAGWRLGPVRRHDGIHTHHVSVHALRFPTYVETLSAHTIQVHCKCYRWLIWPFKGVYPQGVLRNTEKYRYMHMKPFPITVLPPPLGFLIRSLLTRCYIE